MDDDLNQLIVSLNEQYARHLRIYGVLSRLPEIVHQGVFDIPMEMQAAYHRNKIYLDSACDPITDVSKNEAHVVYWGNLEDNGLAVGGMLNCQITDYAACRTYRVDYQQIFPLVTGNALVVDTNKDAFVMQKRSMHTDWNPGAYTVFGGGYSPGSTINKSRRG